MEILLFWPIIIIFLAFPLMTGWVAEADGRNFWFWTILTCFLPVITLILLFVLPPPKSKKEEI